MKGCLCIHCDEFVAASESVRVGKYRAHPRCEENSKRMKSALTAVAEQIIADCEEERSTMRRDCDCSRGDIQCPATHMHGHDEYLNCRFVAGHEGKHQTGYINGTEWSQDVSDLAPLRTDCEASSDPLAVAVRMERAEAEVARLREELRKLLSYNQDIMAGKINYRPVDHIQVAEAALGKDGQ